MNLISFRFLTLAASPRHKAHLYLILIKHLRNTLIPMHHNLRLRNRALDPILALEDHSKFFERPAFSLHEKEIDEREFEAVPEDEQEIVFPARAAERDSRNEGIVETSNVDPEIIPSHSLGARLVSKALNRIQGLQRGPADTEGESEEEDERDLRLGHGVALCDCGAVGLVDYVGGIEGCQNGEEDDDDAGADEELTSASPTVSEGGANDSAAEGDEILHALEEELVVVVVYTSSCEHLRIVISDGAVA